MPYTESNNPNQEVIMTKTIALPKHRLVNEVQSIQRGYYDRLRKFLATASDEQIETIKAALGAADTLGVFAIEQEQEARKAGLLGFEVKQDEPEIPIGPEFVEEGGEPEGFVYTSDQMNWEPGKTA